MKNTVRRQKLLLPGRLRCFSGLYLHLAQVTGREGGQQVIFTPVSTRQSHNL